MNIPTHYKVISLVSPSIKADVGIFILNDGKNHVPKEDYIAWEKGVREDIQKLVIPNIPQDEYDVVVATKPIDDSTTGDVMTLDDIIKHFKEHS